MNHSIQDFSDRTPEQMDELLMQEYGLKRYKCSQVPGELHLKDHLSLIQTVGISLASIEMCDSFLENKNANRNNDFLIIKLINHGKLTFQCQDQLTHHGEGDILIIDPNIYFQEQLYGDVQLVVLRCKREQLKNRGFRDNVPEVSLANKNSRDVLVIVNLINYIARYCHEFSDHILSRLIGNVLDMMDILIGEDPRLKRRRDKARFVLLNQVKKYIQANLGNHELNADYIALANGVSVNYLNKVFKLEHTSLMKYVWGRRLALAHEILTDHKFDYLSMGDVAERAGFNSHSHFSSLYHKYYQCSPSNTRKLNTSSS